MKIAVTSQNFRTVTNHAGKARKFIIFEVEHGGEPVEIDRIKLSKEMALHDCVVGEAHPIDVADVLISASFGLGFVRKMSKRGIIVSISDKESPVEAVKQFLEEGVKLPEEDSCTEGKEHKRKDHHEHKHCHRHDHEYRQCGGGLLGVHVCDCGCGGGCGSQEKSCHH